MTDRALEESRAALEGRYRVQEMIGRGGMATVYHALDLEGDREVAIKVLRPELAFSVMARRFHLEVEILKELDHPSILPVYESGDAAQQLYFVMPFARGESLRGRLEREGRLPVEEAVAITRDVAEAVDHAHAHDVIHRDIKPENIIFDGERTIVCDFGVARAVVIAGGEKLSSTGLVIGTPSYMSPEQATSQPDITGAADIYALGCVLYEMLAGEPPFSGPTPFAVLTRQVRQRPASLRSTDPAISKSVDRAVARALEKKTKKRPGSGAELVAELGG